MSPRRGRPPLPLAERLCARVTVRLGRADALALSRLGRVLGTDESATMRRALQALACAVAA